MKILKHSKFVFGVLTISLMLTLLVAAPPAYADGANPPVPVTPPANGKFPGYHTPSKPSSAAFPFVRGPAHPPNKPAAILNQPWSIPGVKAVCGSPLIVPTGIATVTGGQLVVDEFTGNLWFCNTATKPATFTEIATPPPLSPATAGYFGLAVKGTLVALISINAPNKGGGVWTCTFSSATKTCGSQSAFIPLPLTFCNPIPTGCTPTGLAFDGSKNLWYVDPMAAIEVELTSASHYLGLGTVLPVGVAPDGITIDSAGNKWVVDYTTLGAVYKNGLPVAFAGSELGAVTISTLNPTHAAHLYVTVTNVNGAFPYPFVGDISTFTILPSPFIPLPGNPFSLLFLADPMFGISTSLYFTDTNFLIVWLTVET